MLSKAKIKEWFELAVRLNMNADPVLRETLLRGHPRIEGFIARMHRELNAANKVNMRRGKFIKQQTMQDTVSGLTELFMWQMEQAAKKMYETDLEKHAREAEATKIKEFESVLAGTPEGEFKEAGVISNEKIDSAREAQINPQN